MTPATETRKRVLVVFYTQSGDVAKSAQSFVKFLEPEVELTWAEIKSCVDYPYPWKIDKFFDVFPECINEEPTEIYPLNFDPSEKFDLVIIAFQVWFLSPSLPIQSFFKSEYAKVLRDTKVITLIVCRNMWHSASENMKNMIADAGGIHIDNVVVTHQGPPLTTFITTPRLLLTGKKDKFLGTLPPAGIREDDIQELSKFGKQIAENLEALNHPSTRSLLKGLGAVDVNERYIIPEIIGRLVYRPWARLVRLFGKQGSWTRRPIIYLFAVHTVLVIPIILLCSAIFRLVFAPVWKKQFQDYVDMLKSPSEFDVDLNI